MSATTDRIWDIVTKLSASISVVAAGALINHESRLKVLEDRETSRFTQLDAAHLREELPSNKDVTELKTAINNMNESVRSMERSIMKLEYAQQQDTGGGR